MTLTTRLSAAVPSLTPEQARLIERTREARRVAHTMPNYGAPDTDKDRVAKAVRSSMRACAASQRYLDLLRQCKAQGLAALMGEV